jgi:enamine deaminase RidA (YjgF/YER057c/UK114 family)
MNVAGKCERYVRRLPSLSERTALWRRRKAVLLVGSGAAAGERKGMSHEDYEARARDLGLEIPDYTRVPYYGAGYGSMKPHHIVGNLLFLSGHVPERGDGRALHPGRLGADVTIAQGYAAARQTGLNCLGGIRAALGSLNRVQGIVRTLCFVAVAPDFTDMHLVSSGCTDLFRDVFGEEAGLGGRATIGVVSLAHNHCFENWLTVEIAQDEALAT